MALKGTESWDLYAAGDITDKWQTTDAGNTTIIGGAGRCGSAALRNTSAVGNGPSIGVTTSVTGGYAAWAYNPDAFGVTANFDVSTADGSILLFARCVSDGSVELWRGPNTTLGTLIGATPAGLVSQFTYTHLGVEWVLHATTGLIRIYINGVLQFEILNTDTTNFWTSGQWHQLKWLPKGYIDDLYWGDSSGSAPHNTLLGDQRVEGQLVLTDAVGGGYYRQWTPSAGSDHGALVDENPPDNGTTYVEGATIGLKDTFKFPNVTPLSGSVSGVVLYPNAVKSSPGGRQIASLTRSGGSDATGSSYGVAQTTYKYYPQVLALNPVTGLAWTIATVNAMEGGVEIVG